MLPVGSGAVYLEPLVQVNVRTTCRYVGIEVHDRPLNITVEGTRETWHDERNSCLMVNIPTLRGTERTLTIKERTSQTCVMQQQRILFLAPDLPRLAAAIARWVGEHHIP